MEPNQPMGFASACLKYFGKKGNQTNTEFMIEIKALSDKDKADLTEMFKTVGYKIV